jgi:hypothetical protein
MNFINAKNSTGIIAAMTGLLFALLYVGLEILTENPEATNSISVWHFPLIWLLAGILFYLMFYAVGTIRSGKVRERAITFSFSVVVAVRARIVQRFVRPNTAPLRGIYHVKLTAPVVRSRIAFVNMKAWRRSLSAPC